MHTDYLSHVPPKKSVSAEAVTRFLLYKGYICREKFFETDSLCSPSHFVYPCLLYNHIYIYTRRMPVTWILGGENWPSGMTGDQRRHVTVMHRGLELYTQIDITIFRTKHYEQLFSTCTLTTRPTSHQKNWFVPPPKPNDPMAIIEHFAVST